MNASNSRPLRIRHTMQHSMNTHMQFHSKPFQKHIISKCDVLRVDAGIHGNKHSTQTLGHRGAETQTLGNGVVGPRSDDKHSSKKPFTPIRVPQCRANARNTNKTRNENKTNKLPVDGIGPRLEVAETRGAEGATMLGCAHRLKPVADLRALTVQQLTNCNIQRTISPTSATEPKSEHDCCTVNRADLEVLEFVGIKEIAVISNVQKLGVVLRWDRGKAERMCETSNPNMNVKYHCCVIEQERESEQITYVVLTCKNLYREVVMLGIPKVLWLQSLYLK